MNIQRIKQTGVKTNRSRTGNMFIFLFLAAFGAFMALPLVYAVVNAFKPLNEIFLFPPRFFVQHPTLGNFFMLFKLTANLWVPFSRYIFNSLFICVITTAGSVIICSLAAYPLAKYNLSFKWLFSIVVMTLLFNGTVLDIPNFIIISKLNIMNTYWAYVLPNLAVPLGVFLMKQFMTQIPDSLIEAARIDGASQYTIFWRIVMPSVKPAWLTLVIFSFQAIWNQQGIGVIFDEELKTMPAAINQIVQGGIARTGAAMAGSLFLMTPPIVIFLLTQKSVIETMVHSGIKE
ncbi:ABC-type glycerol-3-phosphate transport system permease component [Paenibacillus baekrokdamisoli]|nr:carbohydrate ABC transporter permease [Paenibacillus baekrokdamisoli]MBB3069373.1 ABC-type glycerol-3-phosphate transport system permease component [Paenibacillus baekrokdamisoli]